MADPLRIDPQAIQGARSTRDVQRSSQSGSSQSAAAGNNGQIGQGQDFARLLEQASGAASLKFSNHALKRLESRQIALPDDGLERLNSAVDKAEKRGGRESLVLMDDLAFIVNVRERMVVTAMDVNQKSEGVFTQIDSVVIADGQRSPGLDTKA